MYAPLPIIACWADQMKITQRIAGGTGLFWLRTILTFWTTGRSPTIEIPARSYLIAIDTTSAMSLRRPALPLSSFS